MRLAAGGLKQVALALVKRSLVHQPVQGPAPQVGVGLKGPRPLEQCTLDRLGKVAEKGRRPRWHARLAVKHKDAAQEAPRVHHVCRERLAAVVAQDKGLLGDRGQLAGVAVALDGVKRHARALVGRVGAGKEPKRLVDDHQLVAKDRARGVGHDLDRLLGRLGGEKGALPLVHLVKQPLAGIERLEEIGLVGHQYHAAAILVPRQQRAAANHNDHHAAAYARVARQLAAQAHVQLVVGQLARRAVQGKRPLEQKLGQDGAAGARAQLHAQAVIQDIGIEQHVCLPSWHNSPARAPFLPPAPGPSLPQLYAPGTAPPVPHPASGPARPANGRANPYESSGCTLETKAFCRLTPVAPQPHDGATEKVRPPWAPAKEETCEPRKPRHKPTAWSTAGPRHGRSP